MKAVVCDGVSGELAICSGYSFVYRRCEIGYLRPTMVGFSGLLRDSGLGEGAAETNFTGLLFDFGRADWRLVILVMLN